MVAAGMDPEGACETFWGEENVLYLNRGLGYTNLCICQNSANKHFRQVRFIGWKFFIKRKKRQILNSLEGHRIEGEVAGGSLQFTLKCHKNKKD